MTRRQLSPCGTAAAAKRHRRYGQPVCELCRLAYNTEQRAYAKTNARKDRTSVRPVGRPLGSANRRDEVLDLWVRLRGEVSFTEVAWHAGVKVPAWERMFYRARAAGDPRAVRVPSRSDRRAA